MTTTIPYPLYLQIPATFAQLAVGATVAADFAAANDTDWYRVELAAGQTYLFSLDGTVARDGVANPQLSMVDATGRLYNTVSTGPAAGMPALPFTPPESGTFYLRASGFGNTGAYTMSAAVKPADDIGDIPLTAAVLAAGASVNGTLGLINDADLFAVDLSAGQLYSFRLEGRDGSVLPAVSMQFESATNGVGYRLDQDANIFNPTMSGVADTSGKHYLKINSTSATADYTLRATAVADDFSSVAAGSGALTLGGPAVAGRIDANHDRDWFGVYLEAGHSYQFGVTQEGTGVPLSVALEDPALGRALPFDASQVFTPWESGTYHLQVGAALPAQYQVGVTHIADDYLSTETGSLASGSASGVINYAGDTDYFRTTMEAGGMYRMVFETAGPETWQEGYGAISFGPRMTQTQQLTVGSNKYEVYFRADDAGSVNAYMSGAHLGAYAISVQKVGVDDYGNEHADARPLAPGATLEGSMDGFGDTDSFIWHGEPGKTYEITARSDLGPAIGLSLNPGADGASRGGHYTMTPGGTGDIVVYLNAGNSSGRYDISVSLKEDVQLQGVLGGARIDAGGGFDTIRFDDQLSDYTVTRSGFDVKLAASGGTATVANVERVLFANGDALALDIDGAGGSAYRLYRAAFDRAPDQAGVGFWMNALDAGVSLHDVAQGFLGSAEFTAVNGANVSNTDFVTRLYANILDRAPDAGGFAYWLDALAGGYSRADVLVNFSESAENVAAVAGIVGAGFAYVPYGI